MLVTLREIHKLSVVGVLYEVKRTAYVETTSASLFICDKISESVPLRMFIKFGMGFLPKSCPLQ